MTTTKTATKIASRTATFILAFIALPALAGNAQILSCRVTNQQWKALILLDTVGSGYLKFTNLEKNKSHVCGLKVDYIRDGQNDFFPEVLVRFNRASCAPDLAAFESEILENLTVMVGLRNKKTPSGRVQWLRKHQPEACMLEKFSLFDVQLNSKKWLEGKWGKNAVSDPKRAPKIK